MRSLQFACLFCFVVLCLPTGRAQDIVGLPVIRNFSPLQHNFHRQNWAIAQADNQVLYFANGKGLLSFDGEAWQLTQMPNRGHVRSLDVGADGVVYVGANNDFGQLIQEATGNARFESFLAKIDSSDYNFGRIRRTIVTPEGVYFQAYHRMFRYSDGQCRTWRFDKQLFRIFYLKGKLYASDPARGLLVMEQDEFVPAPGGQYFKGKSINALIPYRQALLAFTNNDGLQLYDGNKVQALRTEIDELLTQHAPLRGLTTERDLLVLSVQSNGLLVLNRQGRLIQQINQGSGLTTDNVLNVLEDAQHNIWVGTQEGISKIELGGAYSLYDERIGINGTIQEVQKLGQALYAGSDSGLLKIEEKDGNYRVREIGELNSYVWDINRWRDELYISCTNGLYQLKNDQVSTLVPRQIATNYSIISRYDENMLIAATDDGLCFHRRSNETWNQVHQLKGVSAAVRGFVEKEKGNYWVRTRSNGVFHVQFSTQRNAIQFEAPVIRHYNHLKGLPQAEYNIFFVEQQVLVRTESDELYRYNVDRDLFEPYYDLHSLMDLPKGKLLPKSCEAGNPLWFDYFVDGQHFLIRATRRLDNRFGVEKFSYSRTMSRFRDPFGYDTFTGGDEVVWLSSMLGILQVDLEKLKNDIPDVPVRVTAVKSKDSLLAVLPASGSFVLPFIRNDLSFSFAHPQYQNTDDRQYATLLEGYDQVWSDWTNVANSYSSYWPRWSSPTRPD
ncbi:MAG: two-component regulator propeller domain-containing protein, partial [Bacteroidota bacterium]